jgi:hypothetical protein
MVIVCKLDSRRRLSLNRRDKFGLSVFDIYEIKQTSKALIMLYKIRIILKSKKKLTNSLNIKLKNMFKRVLTWIKHTLFHDFPDDLEPLIGMNKRTKFTDFDQNMFSDVFRFRSHEDLERIRVGFKLPDIIKVRGYKFTSAEVIMISLVRLSWPLRWTDVALR